MEGERENGGEVYNGRPRFFFTSRLLLYVSTCTLLARCYTSTRHSFTSLIAAFAATFYRESAVGKNDADKWCSSLSTSRTSLRDGARGACVFRAFIHGHDFYFHAGRNGGTVLLLHALFPAENTSGRCACVRVDIVRVYARS